MVIRMRMLPGFRGSVVFDLDGTIVDTRELHAIALQRAAEKFGKRISKEEFYKYFGLTGEAILRNLGFSSHEIPEVIAEKQRIVYELLRSGYKLKPIDETIDLIEELYSRNFRILLFTSSRAFVAHEFLRNLGLLHKFSFVVSAEDVEKGKPDPEGLMLLDKLYPPLIAMVGDTEFDRLSAENYGIKYFDVKDLQSRGVVEIVLKIQKISNKIGRKMA